MIFQPYTEVNDENILIALGTAIIILAILKYMKLFVSIVTP
jgi:hypothetical protein